MSVETAETPTPARSANVRLVAVDERHQPRYLATAADLEKAVLRVLAKADITPADVPGLHALLVAGARAAQGREPRPS